MLRISHALLSARPNQDSKSGGDIGVCAIRKGEDQVDQCPPWRLQGPGQASRRLLSRTQPGKLLASAPEVMEASKSVGRGMGLQEPAGTAAARRILVAGGPSPSLLRNHPTTEGLPYRHPMSIQIGTPSRRQKPGDRGAGALRSHPERSTTLACQLLIPARASRLSRWSRNGAAMRAAMPSSTVVVRLPPRDILA